MTQIDTPHPAGPRPGKEGGGARSRRSTSWQRLRPALPGTAGLSAAALILWTRDRPRLSVVLGCAAVGLLATSVLRPGAVQRIEHWAQAVGRVIATVVSFTLMTAVWVLAILPSWLLNRTVGVDQLQRGGSGWQNRTGKTSPARNFGREPRLTGQRGRRAVRMLAIGALLAVIVVPAFERITSSPRQSPASGFPGAAPSSGVSETDSWAMLGGVPVAQETFPGEPWGADLLAAQEQAAAHREDPVLGWRNNDLASSYVNVIDGRRVTLAVEDPELTVWLFGGSTTYGIGQRDHRTIASHLVSLARRDGLAIEVVNFGVSAYVNWQETLLFEQQLVRGGRPDLAVFLDGANELHVAYERGTYGLLDSSVPITLAATRALQDERQEEARNRGWDESHDPSQEARWAAEQYRLGVQRARDLSARYAVPVVHFWQPTLDTIPATAPGVRTVLDNLGVPPDYPTVREPRTTDAIRLSRVSPIDITDIFDDVSRPVFFDWEHTNEYGARLEAEAMYDRLEPALARAARSSHGTAGAAPGQ